MRKTIPGLLLLLISLTLTTGCVSKKARIFGEAMPTMKAIHDAKFQHQQERLRLDTPRSLKDSPPTKDSDFHWLPNPTMHVYVFEHLSPTGLPVPAYTTFFKFYTTDHIALPYEREEW